MVGLAAQLVAKLVAGYMASAVGDADLTRAL